MQRGRSIPSPLPRPTQLHEHAHSSDCPLPDIGFLHLLSAHAGSLSETIGNYTIKRGKHQHGCSAVTLPRTLRLGTGTPQETGPSFQTAESLSRCCTLYTGGQVKGRRITEGEGRVVATSGGCRLQQGTGACTCDAGSSRCQVVRTVGQLVAVEPLGDVHVGHHSRLRPPFLHMLWWSVRGKPTRRPNSGQQW